jgi:hypothetical protein
LVAIARPAYKHNQVMQKLLVELVLYFREHPIGQALI